MSCYIQQDDRLQGLLTVGENMALAADLKLSTKLDKYSKGEVVSRPLTSCDFLLETAKGSREVMLLLLHNNNLPDVER